MKLTSLEDITLNVLDRWLSYRQSTAAWPGAQICIRRKGQVIFSKAYGYANLKQNELFERDHIVRLASQSKMLLGCLFLQFERESKLSRRTKLVDVLPEIASHPDPDFKRITLYHLLTHRAGLYRDGNDSSFWQLNSPFPKLRTLMKETIATPLAYKPGTKCKYSNLGYALLGTALERISGQQLSELIHGRIFEPLGMTHSTMELPRRAKLATGYSSPLFSSQARAFRATSINAFAGAAGLCSTAEEVSNFLYQYLFTNKLLSVPQRAELLSFRSPYMNSKKMSYGLGLQYSEEFSTPMLGHGGGYSGFTSQTRWIEGTDYVASCCFNSQQFDLPVAAFAELLLLLRKTFPGKQLARCVVSPALYSVWGGTIFVVSDDKALLLDINSNRVSHSSTLFKRQGDYYVTHKMSGLFRVGEPLTFTQNKNGQITSARWGGARLLPQKGFHKACNTVEGAGEDLQQGGRAVENAANENK